MSNRSWRAVFEVPATLQAPRMARHLVAELLSGWRMVALVEDAGLAVSELVANAVKHAPGSDSHLVEVVGRAGRVHLAVADDSVVLPIVSRAETGAQDGRGLLIVAALGAAWGAELHEGGKRVWVEITVDADSADQTASRASGDAGELLAFPAIAISEERPVASVSGPNAGDPLPAGDAAALPD